MSEGPRRAVSGWLPGVPQSVMDGVSAQAVSLGRGVAGDDLFLLALSELPEDSPSRRALEAEGVDSARILDSIRAVGDKGSRQRKGLTFAPAFYSMQGRAQGFAACLGDGTVTPEHVLMALLWDPTSTSSQLLWLLGASRERIIERLEEAGVLVPPAPMPAQREIETGEQVWFERENAQVVTGYLLNHVPPGTVWGFNYEGERAFVHGESHLDLQRLVDEALQSQETREGEP